MASRGKRRIKPHQEAVGARIRAIRGDRSQKAFANLLDSTQGYISDLERGRCFPSVAFLTRLSEISGRSYQWILSGEESEESIPLKGSEEREPVHLVSAIESPELYRLIKLLEQLNPKDRERFFMLIFGFFSNSN